MRSASATERRPSAGVRGRATPTTLGPVRTWGSEDAEPGRTPLHLCRSSQLIFRPTTKAYHKSKISDIRSASGLKFQPYSESTVRKSHLFALLLCLLCIRQSSDFSPWLETEPLANKNQHRSLDFDRPWHTAQRQVILRCHSNNVRGRIF